MSGAGRAVRWLLAQFRRVCWRRSRCERRLRAHRDTVVVVYGDVRLVCLDCPRVEPLGRVRWDGTNKVAPKLAPPSPFAQPDDA